MDLKSHNKCEIKLLLVIVKNGASFCCGTYVLHILGWSEKLEVPTNTKVFLHVVYGLEKQMVRVIGI